MQTLKHYIVGYMKIEIETNHLERFLNLCGNQKIELWSLKRKKKSCSCYISRADEKKSRFIQEKTNTKLKIIKRGGLPFFFDYYRKQKVFLLGISLGFLLLFGLSDFIWEIDVKGNTEYTKEDVVDFVKKNYVSLGTRKQKVNCDELEEKIRQNYDKIAWVSCSLDGCRLSIHMKETLDKKTKNKASSPCDLVAVKPGIVVSIMTQNGTALVKEGDKIKKGDTLISGNIYIFSDSNEILEKHRVIAEGEVRAKTRISYESDFSIDYYEKQFNKQKSYGFCAYICGKKIPLLPEVKQKEGMDQMIEKYPIKLGKTFYLPLSFEKIVTRKYRTIKHSYQKKQAYQEAQRKIRKKIKCFEKGGAKVLSQNIEITVGRQKCTARGYFILEESIAKIRRIKDLTEEEEKKILPKEEVNW